MYQHINSPVVFPPQRLCDPELETFLDKALSKSPDDRQSDTQSFRRQFEAAWNFAVSVRPAGSSAKAVILSAIGGVVIGGALAFVFSHQQTFKPPQAVAEELMRPETSARKFLQLAQKQREKGNEDAWKTFLKAQDSAMEACRSLRRREAEMHLVCAEVNYDAWNRDHNRQHAMDMAKAELYEALRNAEMVWPNFDTPEFASVLKNWAFGLDRLGFVDEPIEKVQECISRAQSRNPNASSLPLRKEILKEAQAFKAKSGK